MTTDTPTYETELVMLMKDGATLKEALEIDMYANNVDITSVFDIVDYLENKFGDLDKVQFFMKVFTNQAPDFSLKIDEKD